MSNKQKAVLIGEKALVVRVQDARTVTADIEGQVCIDNIDVSGDLVVSDEVHTHAPCHRLVRVQDKSQMMVSRADTGTVLRIPAVSNVVLPENSDSTTPLRFEIVGVAQHFKLAASEPFSPTSHVIIHNAGAHGGVTLQAFDTEKAGLFEVRGRPEACVRLAVTTVPGLQPHYCIRGDVYL